MKRKPHKGSKQGTPSNSYSGSIPTNETDYNPASSAIYKAWDINSKEIKNSKIKPYFIVQETHKSFIMPLSEENIKSELKKVPAEFIEELEGIFLMSGSDNQENAFHSRLCCYGTYWKNAIFLHPFPKRNTKIYYHRAPKPSVLHEYKRAGAEIVKVTKGISIRFDEESLSKYYLRDVFIHELGYHVDRAIGKSDKKNEEFANWFTDEYGLKYRRHNPIISW